MAVYMACGNQKGGVGKTTILVSLAGELAKRGFRVLVADFDPQGHATLWLREKSDGFKTVDALLNQNPLQRCILRSKHARLDILPGGDKFVALNFELVKEMVIGLVQDPIIEQVEKGLYFPNIKPEKAPEYRDRVRKALVQAFKTEGADLDQCIDIRSSLRDPAIDENYDVVLIDCAPTATNLLGEALRSSDLALCITVPSGLGADGSSQFIQTVVDVQGEANPDLGLAGILLNNYHREKSETEYIEAFRENWPDHTLNTVIPHDALLMRASSGFRLNAISYYARKAKVTRTIGEMTDEIAARMGLGVPA